MDPFLNRSFFRPTQSSNYYDDYPLRSDADWFYQPSPIPNYYHHNPRNADGGYFRRSPSRSDHSDGFLPRREEERFDRQHPRPNYYSGRSAPRETVSPNVVHVPVHYVQSDEARKGKEVEKHISASSAALRIQRVYRGHLVRKSLIKIASIKREVDEIERFVSREENVEVIKRDGKEKLRVTETLMSLLLKLDSVRGVDCGVRELRKAVIKKAIRLQESLDDAVSGTVPSEATPLFNSDEPAEEIREDNNEELNSETGTESSWSNSSEKEDQGGLPLAENGEKEAAIATELTRQEEPNQREATQSDNSAANEIELTLQEEEEPSKREASSPDEEVRSTPTDLAEDGMSDWEELTPEPHPAEDERKRKEGNKEDFSLLLEENEKMRSLIAELVEKNEVQTQLLMSLTNRVDQLERAFVCDMLRRKKKKSGTK